MSTLIYAGEAPTWNSDLCEIQPAFSQVESNVLGSQAELELQLPEHTQLDQACLIRCSSTPATITLLPKAISVP